MTGRGGNTARGRQVARNTTGGVKVMNDNTQNQPVPENNHHYYSSAVHPGATLVIHNTGSVHSTHNHHYHNTDEQQFQTAKMSSFAPTLLGSPGGRSSTMGDPLGEHVFHTTVHRQ